MPRRKRTGRRTFPKRSTLWLPFDEGITLVSAGAVVASPDLLSNYFAQTGEEVPIGTTIGPVRGRWSLRPLVASAFSRTYGVFALMQLLPEGGRATLPVPGVDIVDAMWYGHQNWTTQSWEVANTVFEGGMVDQEFTTKAMRKVSGNGQELTVFAVSTSAVDYFMEFHGVVMLKLP